MIDNLAPARAGMVTNRLPAIFISHGSPMTALQPGKTGEQLAALVRTLPKPKAIVVASAHWLTSQPTVGSSPSPATIHDFHGFPDTLYQKRYPSAGSPDIANQVVSRLNAAGMSARLDANRGLDHGVWVPLEMMYPEADVPVIPLSIQPNAGLRHHVEMGRALAALRDEGVLLIGSGSITHNLHDFRSGFSTERPAPYIEPFTTWIEDRLEDNDIDSLLDYRQLAPFAERAHPTDEHLLPLYFAMGAAGSKGLRSQRLDAGVDYGFLAMDIYTFDA